jgi:DNA-directed RNA polymerase
MEQKNLNEVQRQLEQESVSMGVQRYRDALADDLTSVQPGISLMKRAIGPVAERIDAFVKQAEAGRAGKAASVAYFMAQFDSDVVAYMAVRKIINGLTARVPLTRLAASIGTYLEDAVNFENLRTEAPGLYRQLQRRIATRKDAGVRHLILRRQSKYAGLKTVTWDQTSRVKLGLRLIDFVVEGTGLIEIVKIAKSAKDTPYYVVATPGTMEWLEKANARCELLAPMLLPMVVQPKAWTTPLNGGYLTHRTSLIKVRNEAYLSELREVEMPAVYSAINALQETRWRINKGILGALKTVWDSGQSLGKLPTRDSLPVPVSPQADFDTPKEARTEEQNARIKAWKTEANKVYSKNMQMESKRLALSQKLWVADKFTDFEAMFFPWVMDWRGRAYPLPATLSPQGDDSAKALLEFADGKPLGENGAYWLAVHGANNFGVDKVSFEERVQWVQDNEDAIVNSAFEPLRERFWTEADKPWQFLAFCMEWAGLKVALSNGADVSEYVSYLPVGLDGSCNGLQNFSAMLRDEIGGAATNLVPSEKPSDIYTEVAKVMQGMVEFDAGNGNETAALWLGKVDRKVAKRPCMTYAYAATQFGMKDQTIAMLKKYEEDNGEQLIDDEHKFAASVYLAGVAYSAIGQVVIAAKAAMDWLQEAARIAAKDALPIRWTTPVALPVLQNYRDVKGKIVEGEIAGERVQLVYSIEGDRLNKRKQASGIAPNFIHSMDAAHMMATVNACKEQGMTHFAMIHDSYGAHACDIDVLAATLRFSFVQQYSSDVLGTFREQLVTQLPPKLAEEIPPLPTMGTLDLQAVENSEYFFA